jgi:hypothetical protein
MPSCAVCLGTREDSWLVFACARHAFCKPCTLQVLQSATPACPLCRSPAAPISSLVRSAAPSTWRALRPLFPLLTEPSPLDAVHAVEGWTDAPEQAALLRELFAWGAAAPLDCAVVRALEHWHDKEEAAALLVQLGLSAPAVVAALQGWRDRAGSDAAELLVEWLQLSTQPRDGEEEEAGLERWSEAMAEVVEALEQWGATADATAVIGELCPSRVDLIIGLKRWRHAEAALEVLTACRGGDSHIAASEWAHPDGRWWQRGLGWHRRYEMWRGSRRRDARATACDLAVAHCSANSLLPRRWSITGMGRAALEHAEASHHPAYRRSEALSPRRRSAALLAWPMRSSTGSACG